MDLGDVMDEIGDQLDTIDGLRVYRYPPDSVSVPAAIVTYPDDYEYDKTYSRGSDGMNIPVVVMVGKVSERTARDRIAGYINPTGPSSVKSVVEAHQFTSCDSVRVTDVDIDVFPMNSIEYLAATFNIDVVGTGAL